MAMWWKATDLLNLVASNLDGRSLNALGMTCLFVSKELRSPDTVRWLANIRSILAHVTNLEQLQIAESVNKIETQIEFMWGAMELATEAKETLAPALGILAKILDNHPSLSVSIEAHCGLEGIYHMPLPGQAEMFTRGRVLAVRQALLEEASRSECHIRNDQIRLVAWGFQRPLFWAFREGYPVDPSHIDPEKSARNRRVELYLRQSGTKFEVPKRRKRSEIPLEMPLSDHSSDDDGDSISSFDDDDDEDDDLEYGGEGEEEENDSDYIHIRYEHGVMAIHRSQLSRLGFFRTRRNEEAHEDKEGEEGDGEQR